jgi:hypothetical protein
MRPQRGEPSTSDTMVAMVLPHRMQPISAACGLACAIRALIAAMVVLGAQRAAAQTTRPGRDKPAIQRAIEQLTAEAVQAKKDLRLPVLEPDFAARFAEKGALDDTSVLDALTRPASKDVFIDAYIRWQLTSVNPPLPEMTDQQFLKLMNNAPRLLDNPRAEPDTVAAFEKAEAAPRLGERDLQRVRESFNTMTDRAGVIERLNLPALEWRKWIDNQLPARGPRKLQWLIERCYSTISAGWEARDAKGDLTRACRDIGKSAGDLGLSPQQKQMIGEQLQRIEGIRRRIIEDVAFLAGDRVDVTFSNVYVSENDVKKWTGLLNGEDRS